MKNLSLFIFSLLVFTSCKKEITNSSATNVSDESVKKITYNYQDTVTRFTKETLKTNSTQSIGTLISYVDYAGNGQYKFTITINPTNYILCNLYRNGNVYETGTSVLSPFVSTQTLPPGNYNYVVQISGELPTGILHSAANVNIIDKPVAPAGMVCLFGYYNSVTRKHIYTSDWEELGSMSQNYQIEKVLGYMYTSPDAAPNLKPIYRYYEPADGSHFTSDILTTIPGFVYEKILGYASTVQTPTMSKAMTKYYNGSVDDHFVCIAPEVPLAGGFTKDIDFVFGYIQ